MRLCLFVMFGLSLVGSQDRPKRNGGSCGELDGKLGVVPDGMLGVVPDEELGMLGVVPDVELGMLDEVELLDAEQGEQLGE